MSMIKELWAEHAAANGKGPEYVEVHLRKYPPGYKYQFNWSLTGVEPVVWNPDQDGPANELLNYREVMNIFTTNAAAAMDRLKRIDKPLANRIQGLLKRISAEEPSNEILGLYATYKSAINSALESVQVSKETAEHVREDTEKKLAEVAKHFYKVKHSGKAVLYDVHNDEWTWYEDCRTHYGHMKVSVLNPDTGRTYTKNVFDAFKEWDKAPRFDRVYFNPRRNGHYDDTFNLWTGIQVQPEAGEDDLLLWELLNRICDGNEAYIDYIQKWLAHMVQKPWERPGTAIGISGPQGAGKNAFVETVGMLLSTPAMMALMRNNSGEAIGKVLSTGAFGYFVSYDEVFGQFNALAGNKLLLLLDEATWGGFHNQKARFKTAITGPTVMINDKHMKQLEIPNCRRFILLSNDGHYLGVDADDRRLLPLEFKIENRPTQEWFEEFFKQRREGKMLQCLLDRLQKIDLTDWEPMAALRDLEITTGAALQSGSAPDYMHWLQDIAETGTIIVPPDKEDPESRRPVAGRFVVEDELRRSYQYATGQRDFRGWNKHEFVEMRNKILGEKLQNRKFDRMYGRRIPDQDELQHRMRATSRWKFSRFEKVERDEGSDPKPESAKVTDIRDKMEKMFDMM